MSLAVWPLFGSLLSRTVLFPDWPRPYKDDWGAVSERGSLKLTAEYWIIGGMRVFLSGIACVGKTTVGSKLARMLEFIRRNADPVWLHQNEMWEEIVDVE
jgi:hypothetical protein